MRPRVAAHRQSATLVAAALWMFLDVLRMWTPSLITIFGRAAETPPELIGAFALGCAALPLLLVLVGRRTGTGLALGCLLLARVGLAFTSGGRPQLVVASVGTVAGIWAFALVLGRDRRVIAPGIAAGLALATVSHAALGTWGAVWRHDVWGWLELLASVGLAVLAWRAAPRGASDPPARRAAWSVFPVLLLCGVLFSNVGRASAVAGPWGLVLVSLGSVAAVAVSGLPATRRSTGLAAAVLLASTALTALVEVTTGGVTGLSPWWAAPCLLVGTPAAVHLLAAASRRRGSDCPYAVAGGAVLWVGLLFAYYAGYDLGYRADVLLLLVASGVAVAGLGFVEPEQRRSKMPVRALAAVAVAAVVAAYAGPLVTVRPVPRPSAADAGVRVAAYNLRMGYGISGRFEADAVARLLAREGADVVLLSEIDRGWLLNGGQDQLRILARMLGMHAAFGPAADPVWGDAVLSRTALTDVHNEPLPSYGAATGAQVLVAQTRARGRSLTVVATHLQPGSGGTDDTVAQARRLAAVMRRQRGAVVAGGDLNTTPGSRAWQVLASTGFSDALATARPMRTSPADHPAEQIDHLFVRGVRARDPRALEVQLSDHLPVLVDLRF